VLDLLVQGAAVVDGTGSNAFDGWVGVVGERIAAVGRDGREAPAAARTIRASGKIVTPGFVDVHNHSDLSPLILPEMPSTIRQGVTTVVVGNCGSSPWPLATWDEAVLLAYGAPDSITPPEWPSWGAYLDAIDAAHPAVNIATLIGHSSLRAQAVGAIRRPPSQEELSWMRDATAQAVREGAVGLSTGLIYVPGMYATTDEIVAVATGAASEGGIYTSHIRGEGRDLFSAIDEATAIGTRAELPVHISHLKCESSLVWGRADALLARIHGAPDTTGDQYPYTAWNSSLSSLLPAWAPVDALDRIESEPHQRERLHRAVELGEEDFQSSVEGVGWDAIVIVDTKTPGFRGKDLASIAATLAVSPFDAMLALLHEDPDTSCIGHAMNEQDVLRILADPDVFVASDASATAPDGPGGDLPVHPREYGTFPRALALARDRQLLRLEKIVRKMTSLPADRFGLRGRGRIVEGAFADLVVFDRSLVGDRSTFDTPHAFPVGIDAVVVNGTVAWEVGRPGIERAGRTLRRD
jgi:N-acyl-D-amino-acid deacylase